MPRKLLCQRHPIFYHLSVWQKRVGRYIVWQRSRDSYCREFDSALPIRVKAHQSVLVRRLGTTDQQLQINKITNLRIAAKRIDGVVIRPDETFSFWRLVGLPTRRQGYLTGMLLSRGESGQGVGGGLCQLANLLYWMVLHTPLTVIERHHHGFDPFPDDGRVLPFGSGATIFYNYIDLQFRNDTADTFQVKVWVSDKHLQGEIRCDQEQSWAYHVFEREHAFVQQGDRWYRRNQIWRRALDRVTGAVVGEEMVIKNFAEVKYTPEAVAGTPSPGLKQG